MTSTPQPPRRDDDVDAELAFHVEMQTRRFVEAGLDRASARVKALERLGNLEATRHSCRAIVTAQEIEMKRTAWFNGLGQDISYARRVLRRAPLFTITALLTIAVGIGATTAIVSVLKSAMFDAVPYPEAGRLHVIWNEYATMSQAAVSAGEFADIKERNRAFDAVAAIRPGPGSLTGTCGGAECEPERVNAYQASPNLFEAMQSMAPFVRVSNDLRGFSLDLTRIANDLRLLASGPTTGFDEIVLPAVQPGSSIMPGKVNPVIAELTNMVCFQVLGYDTTVAYSSQAGQLELNVMMPVIAHNLLRSLSLLAPTLRVLRTTCIDGISANEEICRRYFERSISLATALNPFIGYARAAEVAKESAKSGKTVIEIVRERKILTEEQMAEVFSPENITHSSRKGGSK